MVTGNGYRRVVTGHRNGKAVVLSDQRREPYKFKTVAGFEHTYMWSTNGTLESDPDRVEQELPKSALPSVNGSLLHIVTFPPARTAASSISDPSQSDSAHCPAAPATGRSCCDIECRCRRPARL